MSNKHSLSSVVVAVVIVAVPLLVYHGCQAPVEEPATQKVCECNAACPCGEVCLCEANRNQCGPGCSCYSPSPVDHADDPIIPYYCPACKAKTWARWHGQEPAEVECRNCRQRYNRKSLLRHPLPTDGEQAASVPPRRTVACRT